MDFIIIIYVIFGLLPSLVWLSYYLGKDLHPEPKKMILKIFLWGALITIPVFFVQIGLGHLLNLVNLDTTTTNLLYWFLVIAFTEEFFKYLVIRLRVFNSYHLDEPLDIMLYMVVAALGFAAVENSLYLFSPVGQMSFNDIIGRSLVVILVRFIGATFLHTLCSAVIGYALALSFYDVRRKYVYGFFGIFAAVFMHGLYDFSLMTLEDYMKLVVPVVIIIILSFVVFAGFEKLKKMKGICKIN